MLQGFRKISAVGLVLLIAMPLVFTIGILVKQKIIQFHRQERLETEQLQTITVAAENIQWVKKGKEILVTGKLFDIKHFEKKNGKLILTGFFDKEEDSLYDQLNKIAKDKNRPSPFTTVISFLLISYYNEPVSGHFQINWQLHSKEYFRYTEKIPSHPVSDIIHPPAV
jgi:hypothetical protein